MGRKSIKRPELWGGIECSFNRVKDHYMDQLHFCGHYSRIGADIDAIAALGVKAMRYPVIWERLCPTRSGMIDWKETVDQPLSALRHHGITPIAGLVHHGSGPPYASISSTAFASGLSDFARAVATRFPWIEYYTPVNEPLTTARFSVLYGHWFPHRSSDQAFAQVMVNEMKAVVLAMREIRKVNPHAKLVQTEDLAKVFSTPRLQYQADFENHRRWLTWDFLCGKVDRDHALWQYFIDAGISETALMFFVDNPCAPDIVGVDYYATSERYLDENVARYPPHTHGTNHLDRYADVEAIRVPHGYPSGIKQLLKECWDRYHLPIAVTEAHINCDFDNQIRWLAEIRDMCFLLVKKGVDIRAVTAWALFGAYGWNSLLTKAYGDYESGAFDVRSGTPVLTPLGDYVMNVSRDPEYVHAAERAKGWWRSDDRFIVEEEEALVDDLKEMDGCGGRDSSIVNS